MKNIIDYLNESDYPIIKHSISDWDNWKKITEKSKSVLEAILRFKLCEISFKNKDKQLITDIVTSNTQLIKLLNLKHGVNDNSNLKSIAKLSSEGIHSKRPFQVLTWSLTKNNYITIPAKQWNINACKNITITEENVNILNDVMKDILKHLKND